MALGALMDQGLSGSRAALDGFQDSRSSHGSQDTRGSLGFWCNSRVSQGSLDFQDSRALESLGSPVLSELSWVSGLPGFSELSDLFVLSTTRQHSGLSGLAELSGFSSLALRALC